MTLCALFIVSAERRWKVLRGDFLSTLHNLHWSHGHNLLAVFTVMCGRESFTQHNVGGCPHVSVCSICVGCLLGSALLWIGHWRALAPRMQSGRCRLVGAWLQTACRQVRYQRLENGIWKGLSSAAVFQRVRLSPLPWPLTPHRSVYISFYESGVVNGPNNNVWDGGAFISLYEYITAMMVYFAVWNDVDRLSICNRTNTRHNNTDGWMVVS